MTGCHIIMSEHMKWCKIKDEGSVVMPSQTFFNLDQEKQKKLRAVAMEEFSNNTYNDVSINQIIQKAGIPRGSFYMYFKDKDDLFEYLLMINKEKLLKVFRECFKRKDGDLYKGFIDLYENIVAYVVQHNYGGMFKNAFIFFDMHKSNFTKPGYPVYLEVKDLINTENLKGEELEFVFIMLFHHLFMTITYCINNDCLDNNDYFIRRLQILCYGIYK